MKKQSLIVITLACAGAASAQSSVTLFGVVDVGVSHYSTKSALYGLPTAVVPRGTKQSQTVLSPSGYNSSRIGFRGTEDLGGGFAASFWLEAPVSNDSGASALSNFGRRSTVSLSGPFGEVRMGRDYTASFWNDAVFDPMTVNGVGTNLIAVVNSNLASYRALATGGLLNGGLSAGTDSYLRTSNAISYFLPPGLGGFYGQLQYAFHENVKSQNAVVPSSSRGRYAGGRFGWTNGRADVALAYGESTVADTATAAEKIKTVNLGASYDFDVAKVFAELSQVKDQRDRFLATRINDKYNGALIGVTIPVGPGMVRVSYADVRFKNGAPLLDADASVSKLALGYVHNLSKRTALYATASRIRIKNGHNNPTIMGVTPLVLSNPAIAPQPTYSSAAGWEPRSAMGYDFGIRHAF